MYRAELSIENEEALHEFFGVISDQLIRQEEKDEITETIDEADDVGWPCTVTLEITDEKWEDYSASHPDEAKVLEPHLEPLNKTEAEA